MLGFVCFQERRETPGNQSSKSKMADLRDPSTVVKQARLVQDEDFHSFCVKVLGMLRARDRSAELTGTLRRLFLLIAATRQRRRVPTELIEELKIVISEPHQASKRVRLLCATVVREVTPTSQLVIRNVEPPVEQKAIPVLLPLVFVQGHQLGYWVDYMPQLIQWVTTGGVPGELQSLALGSLKLISYSSKSHLISEEDSSAVSRQIAHWLRNASTVSAPNPHQRQIFGGSKARGYQLVTEIDGTSSRYFFTVLSIAHHCFPDQLLNIHSFSMLRSWLTFNAAKSPSRADTSSIQGENSPVPLQDSSRVESSESLNQPASRLDSPSSLEHLNQSRDSPDNVSISSQSSLGFVMPMSSSPASQSSILGRSPDNYAVVGGGSSRPQTPLSFPLLTEDSPDRPRSRLKRSSSVTSFSKFFPPSQGGEKTGEQELKEKTCDYCLRLLEQSERKPTKMQDAILVEACVVEAVSNLDLLCSENKALVPKLIEIMKRLYSRISSAINTWKRLLVPVVQFLLRHGETVVFDPDPACKMLFGPVLSAYYHNSSFAFDTVTFCLDNLQKLCLSTSVLSKYFPNLFKILAWYPRTFAQEFMEILPSMVSQDTAVELFHSLLDLPCLAAALCTSWASRVSIGGGDMLSQMQQSLEAFQNPKYKAIFSYILRNVSGHGDTIDKLKVMHSILEDRAEHPRVIVSAQIVVPLLNIFFETLLSDGNEDVVSRMVPAMLDRVGQLYSVQNYQQEIRQLLANHLVVAFQKYPGMIVKHQQDIIEYISGLKNLGPAKEDFYVHLVWVIGEFTSSRCDGGCTVQVVVHYFEALEALTYEILTQNESSKVSFSGRLVSVLMTTLAKLASRCQDLIQRAILCLSKVRREKPELLSDPENFKDLLTRAQELISLLKLPNVAPVILSPESEVYSGRWHRDGNSSLPLLLQTCKSLLIA